MTHLPFVVSAYFIAIALPVAFAVDAARRLRLARRRLAALDPRAGR
jgi:uncharacterized membrane protein YbhN (UPF0104 family)